MKSAADDLVRADLSIEVKVEGKSYGPGKGILVPRGVALMLGRGFDRGKVDTRAKPSAPPKRRKSSRGKS